MPAPVFTPKTLSFLRALARNNSREWFHARRDQYEAHVRGPMVACVERLAEDFRTIAPELVADPKVSLFRPWRDTRFSENKAPLKTHVAAVFPHRSLGRMHGAGLYFEISPKGVWIGGGLYAADTSQLQAVREHIAAHHRTLAAIVSSPGVRRLGGLQGERLTRVPRGFPRNHPAADYLRHRQFLLAREEAADFATCATFYRELIGTFKHMLPLVRFLNEPLVAAQGIERRAHLLT